MSNIESPTGEAGGLPLPIKTSQRLWEARVDRHYRMTLEIDAGCFILRNVGKHDETLDNP